MVEDTNRHQSRFGGLGVNEDLWKVTRGENVSSCDLCTEYMMRSGCFNFDGLVSPRLLSSAVL